MNATPSKTVLRRARVHIAANGKTYTIALDLVQPKHYALKCTIGASDYIKTAPFVADDRHDLEQSVRLYISGIGGGLSMANGHKAAGKLLTAYSSGYAIELVRKMADRGGVQ